MTDKEYAIYSTGYWNGIAYKRERELTDEEIFKILSDELQCVDEEYLKRCVQAILKKASEK